MNKLINYIQKGKGIGALILLGLAAVYAVYYSSMITYAAKASIPYVQKVVSDIAPIKIENGVVVYPAETIKEVNLVSNGAANLDFVIDTTRDELNTANLDTGFYLARTHFYSVSNREVRSRALEGSFEIENQDYTPLMEDSLKWIWCFAFVFVIFCGFIWFLLFAMFCSLFATLITAIYKKDMPFDSKMRMNAVLLSLVSLGFLGFGLLGINLSKLLFGALMVLLQLIVVKEVA